VVFLCLGEPLSWRFMRGEPPHKTPPNKKTTRQRDKTVNQE
jgi:hypothetical protein